MSSLVAKKIQSGDLFNCNLDNFIKSVVEILPYYGVSRSMFCNCEYEDTQFLARLCFYRKTPMELYGAISDGVITQTDAEIRVLELLRDNILKTGISPCIVELLYVNVCNDGLVATTGRCEYTTNNRVENLIRKNLCEYSKLINNGLAHNKYALLALERCDISLRAYIQRGVGGVNFTIFKSILFQIIYTFYAITQVYPGFKHQDLHDDNIMLVFDNQFKFKVAKPKFLLFSVRGVGYYVPYFGVIPKIIDYGFAAIPEEGVISNIRDDKITMYYRSKNDLLVLFNVIYDNIYTWKYNTAAINLLKQLEPNESYINYDADYIRQIEDKIPTYADMVSNSVWNEYKDLEVKQEQIFAEYTYPPQ